MEPDPDFDEEIRRKFNRRWRPVRSIWLLMLAAAASAATMAIIAGTVRHQISPKYGSSRARIPAMTLPALALANQLGDSFVIVADGSIDPKMVVPAPLAIDEAMVFNPDDHGRLSTLVPAPELAPAPDGMNPWFSPPPPR